MPRSILRLSAGLEVEVEEFEQKDKLQLDISPCTEHSPRHYHTLTFRLSHQENGKNVYMLTHIDAPPKPA